MGNKLSKLDEIARQKKIHRERLAQFPDLPFTPYQKYFAEVFERADISHEGTVNTIHDCKTKMARNKKNPSDERYRDYAPQNILEFIAALEEELPRLTKDKLEYKRKFEDKPLKKDSEYSSKDYI